VVAYAVVLLIARGLSHTRNCPILGRKWDSPIETSPGKAAPCATAFFPKARLDQAAFLRRLPFVDGAAGWGSAWTGSERWRCRPKPRRLASSERVAA
jgi:hypothetical protein